MYARRFSHITGTMKAPTMNDSSGRLREEGLKSSSHRTPDGWQGFRNKDGQVSKAGQTGKVSYLHFTSFFLNIYVFGALLACPLDHARLRVFSLLFYFSSKLETAYSLVLMTLRIYKHEWFIWHGSCVKNKKWITKSIGLIPWPCHIWTKDLAIAISSNSCLNKSNEILPNSFLTARFIVKYCFIPLARL